MKATTILSLLICSLFLSAQAAVDAGKSAQEKKQAKIQQRLHVPTMTDIQLSEMVQQQLRSNIKNYNPNKYTISSQKGEVTLKGIVQSRAEAEQIEKEVLRVQGVSHVLNKLEIKAQ